MTDDEFDVLDELYFVQSFTELIDLTGKSADDLTRTLESLYKKGWVKVMQTIDDEVPDDQVNFKENGRNYYYLATKSGLMAHNS